MRMHELQSFGMQIKPLCRLSVERVTHNGAVQAVGMGAMYTELVGAAGLRVKGYEGSGRCRILHIVIQTTEGRKNLGSTKLDVIEILRFALDDMSNNLIPSNSRLSVLEIHHLQGTVVEIGTEREADEAFRLYLRCAFEQGHVALLDGAVLELLLEQGMGVLVLGSKEQAGGGHVETMYQERSCSIGVAFLQHGEDGSLTGLSGYGEHACGFVDHQKVFVFVDRLEQVGIGYGLKQRIGLYIKSLQHERQEGLALVSAGRVVVTVSTDFTLGRVSPPEFCHSQGLETVAVGMLQELGSGTFARSSRRETVGVCLEDLVDVLLLTFRIQEDELVEYPLLQGDGAVFPFFFEGLDVFLPLVKGAGGCSVG